MAARQIASHNDYVKLEALVESGKTVYQAAQQIGLPLGAFKSANGDREWYEQIVAKVETVRAGIVDKRVDELVMKEEPNASIVNAWAKANHPGYQDKQQIEISGTLNHEAKVVTFGDLIAAARESSGFDTELDGGSRGALPGAQDVLPAPAESEASTLPARRES